MNPPIGKGSFGVVNKAKYKGVMVAVKTLTDDDGNEEFEKEVYMLATLCNHPNIVLLVGACLSPRCIVTELIDRGSLFAIIKRHPEQITLERAVGIARDIAAGMLHIHTHDPPVLHRDLKTGNILITTHWAAKITDFGISRPQQLEGTQTKQVGTSRWMAPEVEQGHYTIKADVYSYGIILWELFTKQIPFEDIKFDYRIVEIISAGGRPPVSAIPDRVPGELISLMERCWDMDPANRPLFSQVLDDLDHVISAQHLSSPKAASPLDDVK